jgi:cytochrome b6-f complex iron-sulfur subunit
MSEPNANKPEPSAHVAATPPAATPPAAPPKPAMPAKPAAPARAAAAPTRRIFLISAIASWTSLGWITFTASMLGMTLGTVRFLFPNVLSEPPTRFRAGTPDQYELDKVSDRFKPEGAWIVRHKEGEAEIIYALSTTCTHLGCTPNWLEGEKKFKCPCHGSGFYVTGVNFEGPAPRPLERYAVRLTDEGQIEINKARKFQKELGQWSDPESFIKV